MNLENIAFSRIAEPLSKGENVKKLLSLHISPYTSQILYSEILAKLKDFDSVSDSHLEWFGILKGILRPKTVLGVDLNSIYFDTYSDDKLKFSLSDKDIEPLYFGEKNYKKISDEEYKKIIRAFCLLTGFKGTKDEYSLFFKEALGINVYVLNLDLDLDFILEETKDKDFDFEMIENITPAIPTIANKFNISPYPLFVLDFPNIKGTELDFSNNPTKSFYFSF